MSTAYGILLRMKTNIPPIDQIKAALSPLTGAQLERLAELSGVPVTTISKIRRGETVNPGITTVRLFIVHIKAAAAG